MAGSSSNLLTGFVLVFLSAAFYATMPIFGKFMYQAGLNPIGILLLRYFFSLLILMLYLTLVTRQPRFTRSPYAIAQGLAFIAGSLFYFYAVQYLPAGLTTSIFYLYPAVVAILAIPIYHERLTWRQATALILALGGIVIISGLLGETAHRLSLPGILLTVASGTCYAIYTLLGQKTTGQTGVLTLTATISVCGFSLLALVFPRELITTAVHITWEQSLLGLGIALLNTVLSVILYLKGLQIIGASRAALVSTAEPAFTLLYAYILLNETITPLQGLGIIMVLVSTILALKPQANKKGGGSPSA